MRTLRILADPEAVAREAAQLIAAEPRAAVAARGRFIVAVSGGRTPWQMLRALANEPVPGSGMHVVQVDERIARAGDADRNLTRLRESLLDHAPLPPSWARPDAVTSKRFEVVPEEGFEPPTKGL